LAHLTRAPPPPYGERMRALLLLFTITNLATAQQPALPPVLPGLDLRIQRTAHPDTIAYQRSVTRDSHDSSTGTRTVVMTALIAPGSTLLEVVQRFPGRGGEIVDTAVAGLKTLRAVAHESHQPTRTMRFAFDTGVADG